MPVYGDAHHGFGFGHINSLENLLVNEHLKDDGLPIPNVYFGDQEARGHLDTECGLRGFQDHLEQVQAGFLFVGRKYVDVREKMQNNGNYIHLCGWHSESVAPPRGGREKEWRVGLKSGQDRQQGCTTLPGWKMLMWQRPAVFEFLALPGVRFVHG